MEIYIINKTSSEGFWHGNESCPIVSPYMDEVIKKAYYGPIGYKNTFEAREPLNEEMLEYDAFASIMRAGLEDGMHPTDLYPDEAFIEIQCDDHHIHFEPFKISI